LDILGNVTVGENATLNVSSLNHLDVKELLKSIWLKGSNVDLPHKQTFKDVIINGTLTEVNINRQFIFLRLCLTHIYFILKGAHQ